MLESGKYSLAQISDFNTLVALSQTHQTPIFALSDDQISMPYPQDPQFKYSGTVLETMKNSRDQFKKHFSKLADDIVELTR